MKIFKVTHTQFTALTDGRGIVLPSGDEYFYDASALYYITDSNDSVHVTVEGGFIILKNDTTVVSKYPIHSVYKSVYSDTAGGSFAVVPSDKKGESGPSLTYSDISAKGKIINIGLKYSVSLARKVLRIYLTNFTQADIGLKIILMRLDRHSGKGQTKKWAHPVNYDYSSSSISRMGYGILAGETVSPQGVYAGVYPAVPNWMPHNGFIQTEWEIDEQNIADGYIEIDIGTEWLSLLKPRPRYLSETSGQFTNSSKVDVLGCCSGNGSLKITFALADNESGVVLAQSSDILSFGLAKSTYSHPVILSNVVGGSGSSRFFKNEYLYTSIK